MAGLSITHFFKVIRQRFFGTLKTNTPPFGPIIFLIFFFAHLENAVKNLRHVFADLHELFNHLRTTQPQKDSNLLASFLIGRQAVRLLIIDVLNGVLQIAKKHVSV